MIVAKGDNFVVIEMWPRESECIICGVDLFNCKTGIPMYEGEPVPHSWKGEWAGYDACQKCFDGYEAEQIPIGGA
jgi:hypothetical protein